MKSEEFKCFANHKVQSSNFKVQNNEKDIVHIHALGNGAGHRGTTSGTP